MSDRTPARAHLTGVPDGERAEPHVRGGHGAPLRGVATSRLATGAGDGTATMALDSDTTPRTTPGARHGHSASMGANNVGAPSPSPRHNSRRRGAAASLSPRSAGASRASPKHATSRSGGTPRRAGAGEAERVVLSKRGELMKKRDHLSGWRSRFFVLDGKMLFYYTSQNKHEPKGSVYLTRVRSWLVWLQARAGQLPEFTHWAWRRAATRVAKSQNGQKAAPRARRRCTLSSSSMRPRSWRVAGAGACAALTCPDARLCVSQAANVQARR